MNPRAFVMTSDGETSDFPASLEMTEGQPRNDKYAENSIFRPK